MIRNIYSYLDELNFKNRVIEEAKFIRKAKNTENFEAVTSDFVMVQWVFSFLRDMFEKIYDDVKNDNSELAILKKQLAIAVEALENIRAGNKNVIDRETGMPYFTEELALQQIKEFYNA